MNGYTELAKLFKARDNMPSYSPIFGTIVSLPEVKILCGNRVILSSEHILSIFDINEHIQHDEYIEYVNLNKTVVLLPYSDYQKFIAIGVIKE